MTIMTGELMGVETDGRPLLTVRGAADFLSLSRGAIYNLLDAGALTSIHIGRARRIRMAELRRFVDERVGVNDRDSAAHPHQLQPGRVGRSADRRIRE